MLVIGPDNRQAPLKVDNAGALVVAGGSGGGGGGDASAANQATMIASLATLVGQTDALEGPLATLVTSLATLLARTETPVDSAGAALPLDFDYLPETYGYTSGALTTIVRTKGANTYTRTLTYTSGVLTAQSAWVKA